jgi:hypothetical protein
MKTLLLCALFCGALHSAEIFVAASGNDGAAGSKAAPLATWAMAVEKAAAGDTITLREGTYSAGGTGNRLALAALWSRFLIRSRSNRD